MFGSPRPAVLRSLVVSEAPEILLVEDDEPIALGLERLLVSEGHAVTCVGTGGDAIAAVRRHPFDLVLLDLGLPDIDGIDVCREIRRLDADTTIVILTARTSEIDAVVGLDAGADDYVAKPFGVAELAARIRAHLRRRPAAASGAIVIDDLTLDTDARRVLVDGEEVELRAKEFDLLSLLVAEAGKAVTRERIMSEVWDEHWFGSTKTLDMHVSSLRRKLGDPADEPRRITTLRGVGYRYERP
jgi:DNA-binding response OmpR family regulator